MIKVRHSDGQLTPGSRGKILRPTFLPWRGNQSHGRMAGSKGVPWHVQGVCLVTPEMFVMLRKMIDPLSISASASLGKGDIEVGETLKVSSRAKRVLSINADFVLCISRT